MENVFDDDEVKVLSESQQRIVDEFVDTMRKNNLKPLVILELGDESGMFYRYDSSILKGLREFLIDLYSNYPEESKNIVKELSEIIDNNEYNEHAYLRPIHESSLIKKGGK
jgi:hypothetical protein